MAEILPSIFGANLMALKNEITFLEAQGFRTLHLDMMDGSLVPNIAFGPDHVSVIKKNTAMKVDVHLMVSAPEKIIDKVIAAGVDMISIHYEATIHHIDILQRIRKAGIKAGIVYNPSTPLSSLKYLLGYVDYVLLMSINPGHWGQRFLELTFERVQEVRDIIGNKNIAIEIDGGVNAEIATRLREAGVSLIVVGGALFNGDKMENAARLNAAIAE
ncbi:ribulose-phosphate 3-epimerase [Rouxiella silvae]|uniref:Ribulose-phosphate 3-epimerase n=2 Tax=Rouxiella silvae TaxID=1646373 RepID=A0AA40X349_9GAMM|nr:ribulose-phosphate 3-epimerase [Rouxiella silvae]MBF6637796.1 ribulose-phosphate 3-epimerase [Rouxiella silvae]